MKDAHKLDTSILQSSTVGELMMLIKGLMSISKTNTKMCKALLGYAQRVITLHERAMNNMSPVTKNIIKKKTIYRDVIK
jgi:hypothetical protein